uniref:Uncharacterized protein n=1 Tax=Oryza glumipatula TaxID=40148 RepID=A0A0E0BR88_9ORYZ
MAQQVSRRRPPPVALPPKRGGALPAARTADATRTLRHTHAVVHAKALAVSRQQERRRLEPRARRWPAPSPPASP